MPLGLEALPLAVMAWGIDMLLAVSDWVASLPGADISAPSMTPLSLILISGGLALALPVAAQMAIARDSRWRLGPSPRPDPRGPAGHPRRPRREGRRRTRRARHAPRLRRARRILRGRAILRRGTWAGAERDARSARACAATRSPACSPGPDGVAVAHVLDPAAFPEDCRRAEIVVTALAAPADCRARLVIDARDAPALRRAYGQRRRGGRRAALRRRDGALRLSAALAGRRERARRSSGTSAAAP